MDWIRIGLPPNIIGGNKTYQCGFLSANKATEIKLGGYLLSMQYLGDEISVGLRHVLRNS